MHKLAHSITRPAKASSAASRRSCFILEPGAKQPSSSSSTSSTTTSSDTTRRDQDVAWSQEPDFLFGRLKRLDKIAQLGIEQSVDGGIGFCGNNLGSLQQILV
jgi:hypothetical protein